MATRNRYRGGSTPLRVQTLGGKSESEKLAQQAADLRNKDTISRLSDPLERQLREAQSIAALEKLTDPYILKIDQLNRQLREVQNNSALTKLAQGDPSGFIDDAMKILKALPKNDPNRGVWESMIGKAEKKLIENQWQEDLKAGNAELEDFLVYLYTEMENQRPGSAESAGIIKTITQTKSAIKARDESRADQAALMAFIKSEDEVPYIEYLQEKLSRTTSAEAASTLQSNIVKLQERVAKKEAAQRVNSVTKAYTDFRSKKISAAEAVVELEKVMNDPKATISELNHIQSTVASIYNEEEQRLKSAANGGVQQQAQALGKDLEYYKSIESAINDSIQDGDVAKAKELLEDLKIAGGVLSSSYDEIAANATNSWQTVKSAKDSAAAVRNAVLKKPNEIDAAMLKGNDITSKGQAAFVAELAAIPDPARKLDAIVNRIGEVSLVVDKLFTTGAKDAALADAKKFSDVALQGIRALATTPRPLTPSEEAERVKAFLEYRSTLGSINADLRNRGKQPLLEMTSDQLFTTLQASGSRDDFMKAAQLNRPEAKGLNLPEDVFNRWRAVAEVAKAPEFDAVRGEFVGDAMAMAAAKKAVEMAKRLYMATNNDTGAPTDLSDLWLFAKGTLTPQGIHDATVYRESQAEMEYFQNRTRGRQLLLPGQTSGPKPGSPSLTTTEEFEQGQNQMSLPFTQGEAPAMPYDASQQMGALPYGPQLTQFDSMAYNQSDDPITLAFDALDEPTPLELPGFEIPELPDEDPFMPSFTAFEPGTSGGFEFPAFPESFPAEFTEFEFPQFEPFNAPLDTGSGGGTAEIEA